MRIATLVAALAAGSWSLAAPAAALDDLTGVYDMKLTCKNLDSGVSQPFKVDEDFSLVDVGDGTARFETMGFGPGLAFVLTETAKPDRGVLAGTTCSVRPDSLNGLILRLDVNTKPADPKLKGTLFFFGNDGSNSASCKFTAKRAATGPVKIGGCA
jgi:hypothetical protein